ncbi:DUF998 domain-containing protein [Haladaptatus cibarius]|uniref:DUF998 domain-containing protein n=1 Tax=Haladaptatus cibarius TaxID=453847 RepID=UPI0006789387|nr:DUF998 domain-containing protein [Haladaptatus cibarius]
MNGVIHRYERVFQRSTFARFGAVGLLIVYGTLISTIALSPTFQWTGSALSDLGAVGADRSWLFNGGLIVGGAFLSLFAFGVFSNSEHWGKQVGSVLLTLAYVLSVFVGLFPYPQPQHTPIALAQFVLIPVGLLTFGVESVLRGASGLGGIALALGTIAVAGNLWLFSVVSAGSEAIALPEFAVVFPLDSWAMVMVWRQYHGKSAQ